MKVSLDREIRVYITLADYNEAIVNGIEAEFYLTLDDLYECEGEVPHVELLTKEWVELDSNFIDIDRLSLN